MPEQSPPVPFLLFVRDCHRIEVPLIQRDYAQGRESEKDVRDDFLGALHSSLMLPAGDPNLPLNLDFVYGSKEGGSAPRFMPLDGQQRLTTLFLLHWYLAWRDGSLLDFKTALWDGRHARFTYGVRPSSTEFFDSLMAFEPTDAVIQVPSVRRMLEDQPWFFLHWRLDPTIQGVLTMLDAIHTRFRHTEGLYARLVDEGQPAITFNVLPLEHFGLSDDLYIKMNARGKPLTAFETFKARFGELLKAIFPTGKRWIGEDEFSVPEFFERRMDTRWTGFFWSHQHANFDAAALNLVWALIRVSLDPASPTFATDTSALGEKSLGPSFTLFHDRGWLTRRFSDHLMDLLEVWSEEEGELTRQLPRIDHFDEAAFFQRAIATPAALTYFELVQFAAFVVYLTTNRGNVQKDTLREWMRVVTNLAANSDIERPEELRRSFAALQQLVPHGDRILQRLAEPNIEVPGFSPQQVREEALKAKLILGRPGWRERIEAAEAHGYFRGQIGFLLQFAGVLPRWLAEDSTCWSDAEDAEYQAKFSEYFEKASAVFSADGVNDFGAFRWERALLAKGNYLVPRGLNHSFLESRESEANWKRLLRGSLKSDQLIDEKRQYVQDLLDEIDLRRSVIESLDRVLAESLPVEPWRRAVIEQPEIIHYCRGRNVRWHNDGHVYLMRKVQMNGEHAELFSFHLKVGLLQRKHENGDLAPFGAPSYESVNNDAVAPYAYISCVHGSDTVWLMFIGAGDSFRLEVRKIGGPLPDNLKGPLLTDAGFECQDGALVFRQVKREAVETALDEIVAIVRRVFSPVIET